MPHFLFVILLATMLYPADGHVVPLRTLILATVIEVVLILKQKFTSNTVLRTAAGDVAGVLFSFLFLWELLTERLNYLDPMLFPAPEIIFTLFVRELPDMLKGLYGSILLLGSGYLLALFTAIPLGLIVGWKKRLFHAVNPFAKVLGPIPPIVYIPYAIALLPTFRTASIFVIFTGAFWPLFVNTVSGVFNIPPSLIDAARMLNLKKRTLFLRVLLPGALPSIFTGANLALLLSFLLMTAAELIGATSGIGWYVKNFSDFADYPRVIVGILFISIVVTAITWFTMRLERYLLRYREVNND
ncbi:MAG: ABC transporter permease subunit [Planctomycetaceae bacterium]|nr:ABC transporter permease subunit [Planctomycetaceae bacterium]